MRDKALATVRELGQKMVNTAMCSKETVDEDIPDIV